MPPLPLVVVSFEENDSKRKLLVQYRRALGASVAILNVGFGDITNGFGNRLSNSRHHVAESTVFLGGSSRRGPRRECAL